MNKLIKILEAEREQTELILKLAKQDFANAPEGTLRTKNKIRGEHIYPEYFHYQKQNADTYPDGKYIKRSEEDLIRTLAQKEYCNQLIPLMEKKLKELNSLISIYPKTNELNLYNSIADRKRSFIHLYGQTDEEYIALWYASHPSMQNPYPTEIKYETDKKEIVRSKTEKFIADKLAKMNVPYVYEGKLEIDGKLYYPDFTVLDVNKRKTIYWEHFGKMSDSQYVDGMLKKLDAYAKKDIIVGDNLIATFESVNHPINLCIVDRMILALREGNM